jgi:hypothetical protein
MASSVPHYGDNGDDGDIIRITYPGHASDQTDRRHYHEAVGNEDIQRPPFINCRDDVTWNKQGCFVLPPVIICINPSFYLKIVLLISTVITQIRHVVFTKSVTLIPR